MTRMPDICRAAVLGAALAALAGCDGKTDARDTSTDVIDEGEDVPDVVDDVDAVDVPDAPDVPDALDAADSTGLDSTTDPDGIQDPLQEDALDDAPADAVEETVPTTCGDSVRDPGEVCDDGNRVTEACDEIGPRSCLSDCSLWTALCGDGYVNLGEQCDDGNDDSMDGCTTSCTVNDGAIGSPCTCTGEGCSTLNFTTGDITGCGALPDLADSSRIPACLRSVVDPTYGFTAYFPGGSCTLMAVSCEGLLCGDIDQVGDVDAFTCPEGTAVATAEDTVFGTHVITRTCHPVCETQADCRWNEHESADSPFEGCGRFACLPDGDGGQMICMDERM